MSIKREIQRRILRENMKLNAMRSRCRKCGDTMVCKPGYGWLCPECGWKPMKQREVKLWTL